MLTLGIVVGVGAAIALFAGALIPAMLAQTWLDEAALDEIQEMEAGLRAGVTARSYGQVRTGIAGSHPTIVGGI